MKLSKTLLLATALLVSAAPAHAWKEIGKSGQWKAWSGNDSTQNPHACWMTTNPGKGWNVGFKWIDGMHYLFIEKQGWRVPQGVAMRMSLQFDSNKPITGDAAGTGK